MTAPRWEDVPATDYDAEARAWVVGYLTSLRDDEAAEVAWRRADDNGTYVEATARMHEANLRWLNAALARLAEPAQSSAATTSSPCARCGHAWHEHVDRDSDNACQANGCPCARWYGGAQSSTPAAPAQPSAAERWRAVPERAREATLAQLDLPRSQCFGGDRNGVPYAERVEAERALLALARDAEGTPAPAEPAPPTRTPCHRCGKPLARRGVYHVCPHRVPCGSSGWCRVCANRSGA